MKNRFVFASLFILMLSSCDKKEAQRPEPHLELGQDMQFIGSDAARTYVITGYRRTYQGPVDKDWNNQDYIVFVYINNLNDVKDATIHRNSVLKQ